MKTYSLISQKGGAGKSMLARQLAVLASEEGPAYLVDRDPQRTSTKWFERRAVETPGMLDADGAMLAQAMKSLGSRPGTVFVDTRPSVGEAEAEAARVADLVVVPVRPSLDDIEAAADTLRMLRRLQARAVLVVNAARSEGRARDARAALGAYPVPVCPVHIADRAVYLDASAEGRGVSEMRGPAARAAAHELRAVWDWIKQQEGM